MSSQSGALQDVYNVIQNYGDTILIYSGTVERDSYGSIISRQSTNYSVKSFPITLNPSRKEIEKSGFTETFDALFYCSKKEFDNKGIVYQDIDIMEWVVLYGGVEYTIKEKSLFSQYGNDFLYIVLGGHKK